jgi:Ca2+-binding RTX toxin-like protein
LLASSDSGKSDIDNITNDATPTIRVTLNGSGATIPVEGDVVTLYEGATQIGIATLDAVDISAGYVDITSSTLGDGSKSITATVTDIAGNISNAGSLVITLDTSVVAPIVTLDTDGENNFLGTYTVSGTEAGATIEYSVDSTNGTDGTWTTTAPTVSEGANRFYVRQTDVAGNTSIGTLLEFAYGTGSDDTLLGDGNDNIIAGGAGHDSISGMGGNDTLYGDAGNDTLMGGTGTNTLFGGDGNDIFIGGTGSDFMDGGAGEDTTSYAGAGSAVSTSLATGGTAGDAAGDSYADVENLIGSAYDDTLIGDSNSNTLSGGAGNDTLSGGAGADTLEGGSGVDTASYTGAGSGVIASLTGGGTGGDAAGDSYAGIENLTGSAYGDTLVGDANNNTLSGGDGNDTLIGGAGADILDGGSGTDTASYADAGAAVAASLASGGTVGDAAGDSYAGIENLVGSSYDDTLTGDANDNILTGGSGADALSGGGGSDTASYANAAASVTASLGSGGAEGDAAGDSYSGIENLTGSAYDDTLTGDANNNVLTGGAGDDILEGRAGADIFIGGTGNNTASYVNATESITASLADSSANTGTDALGDSYTDIHNLSGSAYDDTLIGDGNDNILVGGVGGDTLVGGAGSDTASYANATAGVRATLDPLYDFINTGDAGGDTFTGIENLTGSNHNDTLYGYNGANVLDGGLGDDTLSGAAGNDTIYADQGHDIASGGDNSDTIHVSANLGNLPNSIDGGTDDGGTGDTMVLHDLVIDGSYDLTDLANVTNSIETVDVRDGFGTEMIISSQDVQNMVDNGNASELIVKGDNGDTINLGAETANTITTVIDATHTDYTIYSDDTHTLQVAQIHWETA